MTQKEVRQKLSRLRELRTRITSQYTLMTEAQRIIKQDEEEFQRLQREVFTDMQSLDVVVTKGNMGYEGRTLTFLLSLVGPVGES